MNDPLAQLALRNATATALHLPRLTDVQITWVNRTSASRRLMSVHENHVNVKSKLSSASRISRTLATSLATDVECSVVTTTTQLGFQNNDTASALHYCVMSVTNAVSSGQFEKALKYAATYYNSSALQHVTMRNHTAVVTNAVGYIEMDLLSPQPTVQPPAAASSTNTITIIVVVVVVVVVVMLVGLYCGRSYCCARSKVYVNI